jgi:hypothetical protein
LIQNLPALVGRQGFEPWKPMATDLQSAPFGHLGTCPKHPAYNTVSIASKRETTIVFFVRPQKMKSKLIHAQLPLPSNKDIDGELMDTACSGNVEFY